MATETGKSSNKPGEPPSEASRNKRAASDPEPSGLIAFTLDVRSGRIVKVESVDPGGDRRELSAEQALHLATRSGSTLEDVLERAFEAGISSVLDDASLDEAESETEEESDLRRAILRPMMERSAARHLLKREVLGRAILGTLIEDALAAKTSASKPSTSKTSTPSASATAPKPSPSAARPAAGGTRSSSSSSRQPPRGRPH